MFQSSLVPVLVFLAMWFLLPPRSYGTLISPLLQAMSTRACFGAGCYWGTEKFFKSDFGVKVFKGSGRVKSGKVGFMNPDNTAPPDPSYREVCSGRTGYVEVYDFEFEGDEKTYEDLCRHFFMFHDPTTIDKQGNDRGTQYASAIFVYDEMQEKIATKVINEFETRLKSEKNTGYAMKEVVTYIAQATKFYPAEDYHQEYLDNNPGGYCNHGYRINMW